MTCMSLLYRVVDVCGKYVYVYIYICVCVCVCVCVYTCIYVYMYIYTCIYIHVYIDPYECKCIHSPEERSREKTIGRLVREGTFMCSAGANPAKSLSVTWWRHYVYDIIVGEWRQYLCVIVLWSWKMAKIYAKVCKVQQIRSNQISESLIKFPIYIYYH